MLYVPYNSQANRISDNAPFISRVHAMRHQEIVELIQRELPRIIQSEPALQALVLNLARQEFGLYRNLCCSLVCMKYNINQHII